ncbi:hypothetical protein BH24CHL4_BH24CHL4_19560 [soil metagenome]
MTHKRKRPAGDRANPESEPTHENFANDSRIPPDCPNAIAKPLVRLLKRSDEISDAGAAVSISISYFDNHGIPTGLWIADRDTRKMAAAMMSRGVQILTAGKRAET